MNIISNYINGNSNVTIYDEGTRHITYPSNEKLSIDTPLNIDIKVTNKCSLGYNPKTDSSICSFCHESARTDGGFCDFELLKSKLKGLPKGLELAIGANSISESFIDFLRWTSDQGYINNLTINQFHIKKYATEIRYLLSDKLIYGLGISLRDAKLLANLPEDIIKYPNTVIHVIAGLDNPGDIQTLLINEISNKILILGYKTFGFGDTYFEDNKSDIQDNILQWRLQIANLINLSKDNIISFDNLALDQLLIKDIVSDDQWDTFYQHEFSMYINAPDGLYSESSRSGNYTSWESTTLIDYFKSLNL